MAKTEDVVKVPVEIVVNDDAIRVAEKQLDKLEDKSVKVDFKADTKTLKDAEKTIQSVSSKPVKVKVESDYKEIRAIQKEIQGLSDKEINIDVDAKGIEDIQKRIDSIINKRIDLGLTSTDKQVKELLQLEDELRRITDVAKEASASVKGVSEGDSSGLSSMGDNVKKAFGDLKDIDITKPVEAVGKLGDVVGNLPMAATGIAAVGVAVAAVGKAALDGQKALEPFNKDLMNIGVSAEGVQRVQEQFAEMGSAVTLSSLEMTSALDGFIRQGLVPLIDGVPEMKAVEDTMSALSVATQLTGQSTEVVSTQIQRYMDTWKVGADEAAAAIVAMGKNSTKSLEDMGEDIVETSAKMATFGISNEQATGLITSMSTITHNSAELTSAWERMSDQIQNSSSGLRVAMDAAGVSVEDFQKDFVGSMDKVEKSLNASGKSITDNEIFGAVDGYVMKGILSPEAMATFNKTMKDGATSIEAMKKQADDTMLPFERIEELISDIQDIITHTLDGSMGSINETIKAIEAPVRQLAEALGGVFETIFAMISKVGEAIAPVIGAGLSFVSSVVERISIVLNTIWNILQPIVDVIKEQAKWLQEMVGDTEGVNSAFQEVFDIVGKIGKIIVSLLITPIKNIYSTIRNIGDGFKELIGSSKLLTNIWNGVKGVFQQIRDRIDDVIKLMNKIPGVKITTFAEDEANNVKKQTQKQVEAQREAEQEKTKAAQQGSEQRVKIAQSEADRIKAINDKRLQDAEAQRLKLMNTATKTLNDGLKGLDSNFDISAMYKQGIPIDEIKAKLSAMRAALSSEQQLTFDNLIEQYNDAAKKGEEIVEEAKRNAIGANAVAIDALEDIAQSQAKLTEQAKQNADNVIQALEDELLAFNSVPERITGITQSYLQGVQDIDKWYKEQKKIIEKGGGDIEKLEKIRYARMQKNMQNYLDSNTKELTDFYKYMDNMLYVEGDELQNKINALFQESDDFNNDLLSRFQTTTYNIADELLNRIKPDLANNSAEWKKASNTIKDLIDEYMAKDSELLDYNELGMDILTGLGLSTTDTISVDKIEVFLDTLMNMQDKAIDTSAKKSQQLFKDVYACSKKFFTDKLANDMDNAFSGLYRSTLDFLNSLQAVNILQEILDFNKQLVEIQNGADTTRRDTMKSYYDGEIATYADLKKQRITQEEDTAKQIEALNAELADKIWQKYLSSFDGYISAMKTELNKTMLEYTEQGQMRASIQDLISNAEAEIEAGADSGRAEELTAQIDMWNKQIDLLPDLTEKLGIQTAALAFAELGQSLGQMFADGEVSSERFFASLLSSVQAAIPSLMTLAFAELAITNPLLALAGGAVLGAALSGLLSYVQTLLVKKQEGGIVLGRNASEQRSGDHIPALLEHGEFVIRKDVVQKNRQMLEVLNRTGQLPVNAVVNNINTSDIAKRLDSIEKIIANNGIAIDVLGRVGIDEHRLVKRMDFIGKVKRIH